MAHVTRSRGVRAGAALLIVAGIAACGLLPGVAGGLLYLLPAVTLVLALRMRVYPGERALRRLASRHTGRRRRPRPAVAVALVARVLALVPRGGLLIATSIAVRPPPMSTGVLHS